VIYDALIKGNNTLAELELEAMYSGLHKTGDFKISCHEFEDFLWRKGLEFEKFKTFPLEGRSVRHPLEGHLVKHHLESDLVPHPLDSIPPKSKPKERQANRLWQQYYRELFEATRDLKPTLGNLQLPDKPRQLLHALIDKFQEAGLQNLRKTPKPGDIVVYFERMLLLYSMKHQQPERKEDEWGVYTYRIKGDINYVPTKMRHQEVSAIAATAKTPEELARALIDHMQHQRFRYYDSIYRLGKNKHYYTPENMTLAFVLSCLDDIELPPNRWYAAMGETIPDYQTLQKPDVAKAWQAKVDFTKKALQIVAKQLWPTDKELAAQAEEHDHVSKIYRIPRAERLRAHILYEWYPG
jgi:hypothetical protein